MPSDFSPKAADLFWYGLTIIRNCILIVSVGRLVRAKFFRHKQQNFPTEKHFSWRPLVLGIYLLLHDSVIWGPEDHGSTKSIFKWIVLVIGFLSVVFAFHPIQRLKKNIILFRFYRNWGKSDDHSASFARRPSQGFLEKIYLKVHPPAWCKKENSNLMAIYRDQDKLIYEGVVCLAVFVQANVLLFSPGAVDYPANVIYCADLEVDDLLGKLRAVAYKIGALKNTKPEDADEREFAWLVSYEYGRPMRITVPPRLAGDLDITFTTIVVHRKHLPSGYLICDFVPLLIHPESRASIILPARYWPEEIFSQWEQARLASQTYFQN